jgi:hypothetical protein
MIQMASAIDPDYITTGTTFVSDPRKILIVLPLRDHSYGFQSD